MADLKDKYGNLVYRMEGNRIIDKYGNWKYEIKGEYIFDTNGNREFEIRGEWLHDTYGNRLGEMKNLVDFLDPPGDCSNETTNYQMPERKKPEGFWEWAGVIIGWLFYPFYVNIKYFKYTATRKEWWGDFSPNVSSRNGFGFYRNRTNEIWTINCKSCSYDSYYTCFHQTYA
jgi:hypothetical protein